MTHELQPNIVHAVEIVNPGREDASPWLILEWIPQDLSTLLDTVDSNIASIEQHLSILNNITTGLAFMHALDITHRDLKPENILIQRRGRKWVAKIADLGSAKRAPSKEMSTYVGSGVYIAPEFWEENLAYTDAVDL